MPDPIGRDETARVMIEQHIAECAKRYDRLYEMVKDTGHAIDKLEGLMWRIMWGGVVGLASVIGILIELRKNL